MDARGMTAAGGLAGDGSDAQAAAAAAAASRLNDYLSQVNQMDGWMTWIASTAPFESIGQI
jgi:hypothetical protein